MKEDIEKENPGEVVHVVYVTNEMKERLNYGWFIYQLGENGLTYTNLSEYLDRPNENYCLSVTFAEMLSCIPDKE